ncbi:MAG: hypothetical protein AAF721_32925 [Myxococcota bacterium]
MSSTRVAAVHAAMVGLALCAWGCAGDDADAGDDPSTSSGAASTAEDTAASTAGDTVGSSGGTGDTPDDSGSTSAADADGTSESGGSGSTGAPVETIELRNDGWIKGGAATYMGGFVQGECWAATFVPEAEHYPFVVDATRMLVGGSGRGTELFTIGLWSVDENNQPDAEMGSASVELTGNNDDIDVVLLELAGIESPVFTEGNFALVGCLEAHDNFPAIAADADGKVAFEDRSWIRTTDGTWAQSASLAVGGDWVMRAVILPQR